MKHCAFLVVVGLAGSAIAQPANPQPPKKPPAHVVPQPKLAVIEAKVLLIGCAPMKAGCGILMRTQAMAIRVTKVDSGPMKVGDSPVVDVLVCSEAPLLHTPDPKDPFVELDRAQIREGSKIRLELTVYPDSTFVTTDKISVTKL